jgi:transposase
LKAAKRGRRPGEQKALDPKQEARLRKAVLGKFPDQVALPGLVWTRPQVRQLVRTWFGIGLSLVTIGKYLRSWGLSPQKPIRRAYEQNPEAVARWLAEDTRQSRRALRCTCCRLRTRAEPRRATQRRRETPCRTGDPGHRGRTQGRRHSTPPTSTEPATPRESNNQQRDLTSDET